MAIKFTAEAKADLAEILTYGSEHFGKDKAVAFLDAMLSKLEILLSFPDIGPLSKETKDMTGYDLREFIFAQYVILYRQVKDDIIIEVIIPKGRPLL